MEILFFFCLKFRTCVCSSLSAPPCFNSSILTPALSSTHFCHFPPPCPCQFTQKMLMTCFVISKMTFNLAPIPSLLFSFCLPEAKSFPSVESSVSSRLSVVRLKKRSREDGGFFGSPQHFVPLRFESSPLYFSSAGAQFLPPLSPVIKPVQNRSLTFKYFLGSVLVFYS